MADTTRTSSDSRRTAPLPLLLGVDLEDIRLNSPGGVRYPERVPQMLERYLRFFDQHGAKVTFFTVGDIARRYPRLLQEIEQAGHEIACHTDLHRPLNELEPATFRDDLQRCLEAFDKAQLAPVKGFRAPMLSLTKKTAWAYDILEELGFSYSSSVLPAHNPLHGWPEFGSAWKQVGSVWEIPVTLLPLRGLTVPFVSGVYFRALPRPLIGLVARYLQQQKTPLVGYLHPYDIDTEQDRFRQDFSRNSDFYHWLMFYNRQSVFRKLEYLLAQGFSIIRYDACLQELATSLPLAAE